MYLEYRNPYGYFLDTSLLKNYLLIQDSLWRVFGKIWEEKDGTSEKFELVYQTLPSGNEISSILEKNKLKKKDKEKIKEIWESQKAGRYLIDSLERRLDILNKIQISYIETMDSILQELARKLLRPNYISGGSVSVIKISVFIDDEKFDFDEASLLIPRIYHASFYTYSPYFNHRRIKVGDEEDIIIYVKY